MNFWGASSTTHLEWVSIGMMGVFFLGPYIATYGRLLLWLYPLIIPTASPRKVNSIQSLDIYIYVLVGGFKHFSFSIICGIILPID